MRLQRYTVIDVLSLSPRGFYQQPWSWGVSTGVKRFIGQQQELHGYLHVGFGQTVHLAGGRAYALGEAQLLADNQIDEGYQLTLGPRVGWLYQNSVANVQVGANWPTGLAGC